MTKTNARRSLVLILAVIVAIGLAVGLLSLYGPNEDAIRSEFASQNPGVEIIFLHVGDGDFDNAWYHIGYRKQGELDVPGKIVLYQREGREWKTRYSLKVP